MYTQNTHNWYIGNKVEYSDDSYFPDDQMVRSDESYALVKGPSLVWYTDNNGEFDMTKNMYMVRQGEMKKFLKPSNPLVLAKVAPFIDDDALRWSMLEFNQSTIDLSDRRAKRPSRAQKAFVLHKIRLGFPNLNHQQLYTLETYAWIDKSVTNKWVIRKQYGFTSFDYAINIMPHQIHASNNIPVVIVRKMNSTTKEVLNTSASLEIGSAVENEDEWEKRKIPEKRNFTGKKMQAFLDDSFAKRYYTMIYGTRAPMKERPTRRGAPNLDDGSMPHMDDPDDQVKYESGDEEEEGYHVPRIKEENGYHVPRIKEEAY